ncbi:MAG: peptidoglycan-binding protein [Christensenellaceae bacterium]|jgi:hypothetical protein|nr:peptidoglycan-binding protein [Christensenellaceae bacterium]
MFGENFADAVYTDSNGGRTTSAKERWGKEIAYLPAQNDVFDQGQKNGHGVGMSQRGAQARALAGGTYDEILRFYYPGTELKDEFELEVSGIVEGSSEEDASIGAPAGEALRGTIRRVLKVAKPLMRGEDVENLQAALIVRGYSCGASGADGVFGGQTAAAVRRFQAHGRLVVDGKVGKFTAAALGLKWEG